MPEKTFMNTMHANGSVSLADPPEDKRPQFTGPERDELAIRMLCAWNNISREQAHADWNRHANQWTMDAWDRVADAVRGYDLEAVFGNTPQQHGDKQ